MTAAVGTPGGTAAPLRAAIVGCGDVSVIHAEALTALAADGLARLVAVADTDPAAAASAQARYGVPAYASIEDLLERADVDVVHVATPHHQHVDVSLAALAAGVHVVQEKPVAHTRGQADRLVAAAEDPALRRRPARAGAPYPKIGVCFQNRFNASTIELRRLLDEGALGSVLGAYASVVWARTPQYYLDKPWRGRWEEAGGGLLINQALHALDLIAWLGGGIVGVHGRASSRVFGDVSECEDTAEAVFTHPNGTRTTFFASLTAPRHRAVELEITGTAGTAAIGPAGLVTTLGGQVVTTPERAAPSAGRSYWGVSHEVLIRDFYARLTEPTPYWISPREALTSLDMLTAIYDQSDLPERTTP